jgi:hypothetical protein
MLQIALIVAISAKSTINPSQRYVNLQNQVRTLSPSFIPRQSNSKSAFRPASAVSPGGDIFAAVDEGEACGKARFTSGLRQEHIAGRNLQTKQCQSV